MLGVRGLRQDVLAEINAAHRATEPQIPEPHEPAPRRTPAEKLNWVLFALRDTGQAFEEEEGRIRVLNRKLFRQYIAEEDEPIQTAEREDNKASGADPATPDAPKRLPPPDRF